MTSNIDNIDAYVPVYSEGESTWYPSNDAAITLVHLMHAWRDISKLNEIRLSIRNNDEIADKLLVKYMLVEFVSAIDHARKLQGIIRTSPKLILGQPAPYRYVSKSDLERVTTAFKSLSMSLAPKQQLITKIRNNIGAHRSAEMGTELKELWMQLDIENFIDLINCIPAIIEAAKHINLYDWSWMDPKQSVASIFGCRIIDKWDEAFSPEEIE